jgi:hypothetical protein
MAQEKATKAFEDTVWFKDEFGLLSKAKKYTYVAPKAIFNLNSIESHKTIHDRHQNQKEATPTTLISTLPHCSNARGETSTVELLDSSSDDSS